jgi:thiamine kinase-like enzyme
VSALNLISLQQQLATHLQQVGLCSNSDHLHLLSHGESNLIFQLDQTLIRIAVTTPNQRFSGQSQRVTQFEQVILNYLQGTGIGHQLKTAQLKATPDFPYTYLITNYLPGSALNYSRPHLERSAKTLAHLHRLPQTPGYEIEQLQPHVPIIERPLTLFYQESQDYAQPYLESAIAEPEIVKMLHAVLDKAKSRFNAEQRLINHPHRCLVHSDHTYDNWVINPQQAYLIDWEWAEIGSPAGDLGHFLSPLTIRRRQNYRLPPADRAFFLEHYYRALDNPTLAATIEQHFAAFGPYPAVRSLCWTAGYWITASRWYAEANSPNAANRLEQFQQSRQQFPELWQEIMEWLDEA